jgi:hypothetical protein
MYAITPKERLRQYAKHVFGEYKALELKCGLTNGTIGNNSEPNVRVIQKVLDACPDLSPEWLILGVGSMQRTGIRELTPPTLAEQQEEMRVEEPTKPYRKTPSEDMVTIPSSLLKTLNQQLENKDAQIATLLQILNK